ncbi:hypothetical protein ACFQE5_22170 [Pseudonocardia hispaniensis]|uniref:Uncharacterized protein n=1 Tax=Pseudonocardia hispaniensis TaxID=904933 RepID=A0ABW1J976_9PSEU
MADSRTPHAAHTPHIADTSTWCTSCHEINLDCWCDEGELLPWPQYATRFGLPTDTTSEALDVEVDERPDEPAYVTAARYRGKALEHWNNADLRVRLLARADQLDGHPQGQHPRQVTS